MGVTADVGQHYIDIVWEVCEAEGVDAFDTSIYDWCYPHDNNTCAGFCSCHSDSEWGRKCSWEPYPDNDDDFRAAVRQCIIDDRNNGY
jgi:hypothetical protein